MHYVSLSPLGSQPSAHHTRGTIIAENNECLLEIGNHCIADADVLAAAALAPELYEFLEMFQSPLAEMLLDKWRKLTLELWRYQLDVDREPSPAVDKPA